MAPSVKTTFGPVSRGPTAVAGKPVVTGYDREGNPIFSEPKAEVRSGGGGGGGTGKNLFGDLLESLAGKGFPGPAGAALWSGVAPWSGIAGAEQGRDRMRAALSGMESQQNMASDLQNQAAKEQIIAARIANSNAHQAQLDKANAGRGGGLINRDNAGFLDQLNRERMMAEMKMNLIQKMLGGVAAFGGGPLTTTEEERSQQIVNNAGNFEPRDLVTRRTRTEPVNPLDLIRSISGLFGGGGV